MIRYALWRSLRVRTLVLFAAAVVLPVLVAQPAAAQTTTREKNFSLISVPITGDLDAVFFYDDLTRDLKGLALNQVGNIAVTYQVNLDTVFKDATGAPIKTPQFLIVPGRVNLRTSARTTYGSGAIYITELTTGKMASFALPFQVSWRTGKSPGMVDLVPLHGGPISLRSTALEPAGGQ